MADARDSTHDNKQKSEKDKGKDQEPPNICLDELFPITVSAPGIHYTTTKHAGALVDPDSIFFIAYDKTYKKRILHPLKIEHGLSLYQQRPLYRDSSSFATGTISILDLLLQEFGEEPANLHLLSPKRILPYEDQLDKLKQELYEVSSRLPAIALNVQTWNITERDSKSFPGPRTIYVTDHRPEIGPVFLDGHVILLHKHDIHCHGGI